MPSAAAVTGNAEEQAALLAQQVLAGGGRAFPALVAALQHAGFPIRSSDGKVAVQATGQSQGIAFEGWEVNALAELVQNRKTVTAPLDSFADALASPLPALRDARMTDFLLDGVRRNARDADGPLLFWAMFIVELGRQAKTHEPYDLLGAVDPAKTQLDSLQMILIAKRLTGDLAAFAHPEKTQKNAAFRLPSWAVQPVYAQPSPCEMDDASDEIMDWAALASTTGFAKLMDFLESKGMGAVGTIGSLGNYAGIVAAYVQLILSHLAFDIQFEMDGPPPLIRTTARRSHQEPTRTRSLTGTYRPGAWAANIEGTADPDADTLEGTLIRVEKHPGANTTISHIYNWELHR